MRYLIILFILLASTSCFGQNKAFVVMDVSGDVFIKGTQKKVVIGTGIKDEEAIQLGRNGYLLLVCGSSNYVKLDKPGSYMLSSAALCKPVENLTFSKLVRIVWEEFNRKEQPDEWRNHLDNVGAVYRGENNCSCIVDSNLRYIGYYSGEFNLSWINSSSQKEMFLKIYDNTSKRPLLNIPVTNDHYPIRELKKQLKAGRKYFWVVACKDDECRAFNTLEFITATVHDSMLNAVKVAVNKYVVDSAERQYQQAVALENKHMFADAYEHYCTTVKIAPVRQKYQRELGLFVEWYKMR